MVACTSGPIFENIMKEFKTDWIDRFHTEDRTFPRGQYSAQFQM